MHYFCSDAFSALEACVYLHRTKQALLNSAPLWFNFSFFFQEQTGFSQKKTFAVSMSSSSARITNVSWTLTLHLLK